MKKIAFIICFLLVAKCLSAQDIITMKDGTKIKAKIQETSLTELKYKNFYDPDGPTYTLGLDEISSFKYEEITAAENKTTAENNVVLNKEEIKPVQKEEVKPVQKEEVKPVQNNNYTNKSNLQDVVYLKNGSIIRGTILEQEFNKSVKIQTADKNVFTYQIEEIEKMTKEAVPGVEIKTTQTKQSNASSVGKATVYIVRPGMSSFQVPFRLNCDNVYIGNNMAKNYLSIELPAGEHSFMSIAKNDFELKLVLEANKTYYLEQVAIPDPGYSKNKLVLLEETKGQKALSKCKPAK